MTIEEMRGALRFSTADMDAEIGRKMAVALAELGRVGVNAAADTEPTATLRDYAQELFCKAEFNFDGRGKDFRQAFESLRDAMKCTSACREQTDE